MDPIAKTMRNDIIVALATPKGTSGIAVIRCSGEGSASLFQMITQQASITSHQMCHFFYPSLQGEVIDDVMGVFFEKHRSYTGEESFEIDCHGSLLIIQLILEDLCSRGARMAGPGEYTQRAFLNGRLDLCQAEAVADVIHAHNERALSVARKQLMGKLSERINKIAADIVRVLSLAEFHIDFSEEEEAFEEDIFIQNTRKALSPILKDIDQLMASYRTRSLLDHGIKTAIIGAPNAGKSSFLNLLVENDRAIVSDIAGTTRDVITDTVFIDHIQLTLCDTAGIRHHGTQEIEQIGIERAITTALDADLIGVVIDTHAQELPSLPAAVLEKLSPDNAFVLCNKTDLPPRCDYRSFLPTIDHIETSLLDLSQRPMILKSIQKVIRRNRLFSEDVDMVINVRHKDILSRTQTLLSRVMSHLEQKAPIEIITEDLRLSAEVLGEITGRYNVENMLDHIFSQFCVGK